MKRMQIAMIGLGRMGGNMSRRLMQAGHQCVVYARSAKSRQEYAGYGATAAASLEDVLRTSQVIVVFAGVTSENRGFLAKREFELIAPGSIFLLMSRAGIVDFPEFLRQVEGGRFLAATDVFPAEPAPPGDRSRRIEGLLLSPHRAGATRDSLHEIGRQTVADAELILRGLPPLSCRRAQRETVLRSRSKPIERS